MRNPGEDKSETIRRFIEWAMAAGRSFQSSQTGYIHYYYELPQCSNHQTIPIYENALFALALLRSRQIENIKEAQNLLKRLLVFQNNHSDPSCGNFPVYLHEFPFCRDFSMGIQLLAPFYFILTGFRHVLGDELRTAFEKTIDNILQYGLRTHQLHPFPYSIAVRFSAGLAAFGRLFSRTDWSQTGLKWIMELGTPNTAAADSWCHTGHLADLLVAAQMVPHEFKMSCWDSFWSFISDTWQPELACYCGPALHERQEQYEPEVTLYDLYLGYLTGKLAGRADKLKFVHLQAALVHSFDLEIKPAPVKLVKGFFNAENWTCINHAGWAVTLLEKTHSLSKKREKIYPSLRILWGNKEIAHSLVCQNGQASRITHLWNEPIAEMLFDLEEPFESKIEMAREICFYFDRHADLNFTVNGQRTNTFGLGETVILHLSGNKEIQMIFDLVEGEGDFMGHIAQANRPSQTRQFSDKKPRIFDWILFLRTLRRSGYCKIKASISIRAML